MKLSRGILVLVTLCITNSCVSINSSGNDKEENISTKSSQTSPISEKVSWKEAAAGAAGQIFLGSEHRTVFYAFDILTEPNEPVELVAQLQTTKFLRGITDVAVGFYLDSKLISTAQTNHDGLATISWSPPAVGDYDFEARIEKIPDDLDKQMLDVHPAPLLVTVRAKNTAFVVIDLDHTVVDSSFLVVLLGGGKPMADSVEITNRIARHYSLIYLTHRPDLMTHRSKSWLRKHKYPLGPLIVSELKQALGSSGKFKTSKLAAIKKVFPNIKIGIGDKLSDAQAYVDNGMVAFLIPDYDQEDPDEMREMARDIRSLRGEGRLNVVSSWRQIEAGIFQSKKFPPETFADWLDKQATQLKAEEEKKKKDDDKDDDDD